MTTYMAENGSTCDVVGLDWPCGVELSVTMTEVRHTVGRLNAAQKPATNDTWC